MSDIDTVNVLWLFLAVPWVGLQRVNLLFPDHTHSLWEAIMNKIIDSIALFVTYCNICLTNERRSNPYEACN